jgi:predicted amidohydrolase YtcJ
VTGLLLRDAEVDGRTHVDVRVHGGRIVELGHGLERRGAAELDCQGGALLPGLTDAHIHLLALAAAGRSVACGPPAVTDRAGLAEVLAAAPADASGWVRGIGYVESIAGDLDADALDRLHGARPVRIQHRSGALWMLNGLAVERLRLPDADAPGIERDGAGRPTGRLWRADGVLHQRLPPAPPPDLTDVGRRLTAYGITAVTEATPDLDVSAASAIADARADGALPQRVHFLGLPPGAAAPAVAGATVGPCKIVLADSGLPDLDGLAGQIGLVHRARRGIAAHCVTREALVLLLAALDIAGPHPDDRIEHGALVPEELVPDLARRGLAVVTQPGFLAVRGDDYLRGVPAPEHADLYRCRTLLDAGVPLALSSDAPYGPLDPWAVMAAAVQRRTAAGRVLGATERLTPAQALDASLGPPSAPGRPRRLEVGGPADLVLLDRPRAAALDLPDAGSVRTVLIGGEVVRST